MPNPPLRSSVTGMAANHQHHHHHGHHHGHVHLDEAAWAALADQTELEGEVLLSFVTDTAAWVTEQRGASAPPVRHVIDIGSGPGVGTCELATRFPDAHVIAVDSSTAMLDRTTQRAAAHGLAARISIHHAELPDGLDGLGRADLIWASMSLHHVGDEVAALRELRAHLAPDGLIAIAEMAEPMRVLPDDVQIGRPGLLDRLDSAGAEWFAAMRAGLADAVPSADLPTMVGAAGLEVVGSRLARKRLDAPLADDARRVAFGHLRRVRDMLSDQLDADDLTTLDVLTDADDPRGVMQRADAFLASSRQIVLARPIAGQ
jgi:SAM-dependent methyltransferase